MRGPLGGGRDGRCVAGGDGLPLVMGGGGRTKPATTDLDLQLHVNQCVISKNL